MPEKGFTLIEFAITTIIIVVISAMGILVLVPTWRQNQTLQALDQVKTTLRQARETSIAQRRTIVVTFTGNNTINLFQVAEPANTVSSTAYLSIPIAGNVQFMTFAGEVQTPDSAAAMPAVPAGLNFPGAVGNMQFNTDGSFSDSTGTPITSTIFLGVANMPASAAAVTIMGTTGRVRSYRGSGTGWWR
jgi:prepilin-type N-terminal cleavage/methylation domain-containing protein